MRVLLLAGALLLAALSNLSATEDPSLPTDRDDTAALLPDNAHDGDDIDLDGRAAVAIIATPAVKEDTASAPVYSREELCRAVIAAAEANNLPVGFFARLIWQESGFDTHAVSRAGALGIAQFLPEVAAEFGADPFDAMQALPASARFLRALYLQFGNLGLAAAAYNAGGKRVIAWLTRRAALPNETRSYVLNITGRQPEQWIGTKQAPANLTIPQGTQCQPPAAILVGQAVRPVRHVPRLRPMRVRLEQSQPLVMDMIRPEYY
jgi:hypothetical protein